MHDAPIYNSIGKEYNATRCADPYITTRLEALLQLKSEGRYIDVGCGTGNYLKALSAKSGIWTGLDPSEVMLSDARKQCPGTELLEGTAEQIPFPVEVFDGAMANFTFHHWKNKQQGLKEIFRILKSNSRLVMLSFTGFQMDGYWLKHYFPEMILRSGRLVPEEKEMKEMLLAAGFTSVFTENYFILPDLQDHFLYSNKFRPEKYLDPAIRKGISSFAAFSTPDELHAGLLKLEEDIRSGAIDQIMKQFENERGDYLFYIAEK